MTRVLRTPTSTPLAAYGGVQKPVHIIAPAAGAEWSFTLPGDSWWRLLGGITSCVTSATVANRFFGLRYTLAGVAAIQSHVITASAASATVTIDYLGGSFISNAGAGVVAEVAFPPVVMQGGNTIGSHTIGIQAADAYGTVDLLFEQVFTGPDGQPYGATDTRNWTRAQEFDVAESM